MKRASISIKVWGAALLCIMLMPRIARGDGSIVRLQETRGPFSVTVFVSPEAIDRLTDVSVLVQSRNSGDVLLDADVSLSLIPPNGTAIADLDPFCGPSGGRDSTTVLATRERASNKLLYAALLKLDAPGNWKLNVTVSRSSDTASFDCFLPVTTTLTKLSGLWPYLAFPPIAIAAFALNQKLRRDSLEKRA